MEAAYLGVKLWAQTVETAQDINPSKVKIALAYQSYKAPQGVVTIDPNNQHLWKTVRIGQIQADGQFKQVWSSGSPIRPAPFPAYRRKDVWLNRLELLNSHE